MLMLIWQIWNAVFKKHRHSATVLLPLTAYSLWMEMWLQWTKSVNWQKKYNALVMVDESHSAGVVGPTGHGVAEQFGVYDKIDIFTGTLGKAFGGAMGGFTTGKKEIIDMLRQRSRPYLFSNSVAPAIVGASWKCSACSKKAMLCMTN